MVKFESIIKTKNDSISNNGIIFSLLENKINFLFSNSIKNLWDILNIMTGFDHPFIGSVIYDDYNLTNFSFKDRVNFIKNNIAIVSEFSFDEYQLTIEEYLNTLAICLSLDNKKIDEIYQMFDFKKDVKIIDLPFEKRLELLFSSIYLNDPKYIFAINIDNYISQKKSFNYFFELLTTKLNLDEKVLCILTNQWINKKDISSKKFIEKVNVINADNYDVNNHTFLIRTKKYDCKNKNLSIKNFLFLVNNILKNNILFISFLILINIIFSISSSIFIIMLGEKNINPTLITTTWILFILILLLFFVIFPIILFKKINNWIYFYSRKGIHPLNIIWMLLVLILFIKIFYLLPLLLIMMISIFALHINISWAWVLLALIIPVATSLISMILVFAFTNRKMLKKYDELIS